MQRSTVAIIGAGVAGLACARVLREAGVEVAVYDKGRGPGGRCSSRRTPFGRFDHGAQFFTVRDEGFRERVDGWAEAGLVAPWDARFVRIAEGAAEPYEGDPRYVGTPKFNAFVEAEAQAAGAQFGLKLGTPRRTADGARWALTGEGGQSAWEADWVVVATPAEQAADLLSGTQAGGVARIAVKAVTAPTWTLMAAFEREVGASFDAASAQGHALGWASRELSKPGRTGTERWVAHASTGWTRSHFEEDKEEVVPALIDALRDLLGTNQRPVFADAHRWRYAQVEEAVAEPFGLDEDARLATCGDWHVAPRVESAWMSGDLLGRALLARL
jgi:predicted NAD/FAD-dependent oxidoreductase